MKRNSIGRIMEVVRPEILLIQETMTSAIRACQYSLKKFPGWEVSATDSSGLSGGLLCIWNPASCDFVPYSTAAGILLVGHIQGYIEPIKIWNLYGPYCDRRLFWDRIIHCGILRDPNLIIGGDLNFTTSESEEWGSSSGVQLMDYFRDMILDAGLVDVCPVPLSPT